MKRRVIVIVILSVLGIAGISFYRSFSRKKAASETVETQTVKRSTFIKTIASSGKTSAMRSVKLQFMTSGRLSWVGVKEGDSVQQYQTIARLDTREVQKNLEKALRDYASERNDFEQTWRVTYNGVSDPNAALTDTVKRILQKNQWDLEKAVLDVELKHLAWEYSALVSPIAGVVTNIDTPVAGVNITPTAAIFEIIDPESIVFEAKIDEVDIGELSVGQKATVSLDAFPEKPFSGEITSISYAAETSVGGATVFPVKISLSTDKPLRVGYNGDVSIESDTLSDVLTVPLSSVRETDDKKYVYVKTGTLFKKNEITTGLSNDDVTVVTNGIAPGDAVVTKGFSIVEAKQ